MRNLIVTGRIVANAEVKVGKTNNEYLELRIANNEYRGKNPDGTPNNETYWIRVTSFNKDHVKLAPYLVKGKPIEVIGRLTVSPYASQTTGKIDPGIEVMASDILFDSNFPSSKDEQAKVVTSTVANTISTNNGGRNVSVTSAPVNTVPTGTQPTVDDQDDDLPF